jgi:hypothetical protein
MDKTKTLCCRITEKQSDNLNKLAEKTGKDRSECVRKILNAYFKKENLSLESKDVFIQRKRLINEINHIGNNINQIAHNVNMDKYSEYEKKKLFAMMNEVKELLKKY